MIANRAKHMRAMIERYFAACNAADVPGLVACFTPDAVHYFPPGLPEIPWRGATVIAEKWRWCVENLGSRWSIEKIMCSADSFEAVIEWTHWKTKLGTALRGDEWYVFDDASGLISEIRAYYATPVDPKPTICELAGFDYRGRGYRMTPP